ncbi:MAG: hypothetical protein QM682_08265 [Paracoccus sp. (in: a-proteobacteria)]|uniref:hypothetical protein n=1 Tax=Paracoccus sp. TaxID=267 RepID=UPI0039E50544
MRPLTILLGGALLMSACSTAEDYADVIARSQPPGAALKAQLVAGAKELAYDPGSIRDAQISNVATFRDGLQGVCVRADSKNVHGVYVGVQNMGIALRDGKPAYGELNHPICNRPDIPWQPFPELQALSRSR